MVPCLTTEHTTRLRTVKQESFIARSTGFISTIHTRDKLDLIIAADVANFSLAAHDVIVMFITNTKQYE